MGYDYRKLLLTQKDAVYARPVDFLRACADYFEWAEQHPIKEDLVFSAKEGIRRAEGDKVRCFTKIGLCLHIGIPVGRLETYRGYGEEWQSAVELVEAVIKNQKFENAAAGMLNSSIITRDLGLADKQEHTGKDGTPLVDGTAALNFIESRLAGLAAATSPKADT